MGRNIESDLKAPDKILWMPRVIAAARGTAAITRQLRHRKQPYSLRTETSVCGLEQLYIEHFRSGANSMRVISNGTN